MTSMARIVRGVVARTSTLRLSVAVLCATLGVVPSQAGAQGLADLDYEYLSVRGVMLDWGYIFPTVVDGTSTFGVRIDLGFLGPGVRATFGVTRWTSVLQRKEVAEFEQRLETLLSVPNVDLGEIVWADTALHGDVHMYWRLPIRVLTYAGGGVSAHFLRGSGSSIDNTFIEDLLDAARAGVNVHLGAELPLHPRFRIVGEGRFELMENLRYGQVRLGAQFTFGVLAPGET